MPLGPLLVTPLEGPIEKVDVLGAASTGCRRAASQSRAFSSRPATDRRRAWVSWQRSTPSAFADLDFSAHFGGSAPRRIRILHIFIQRRGLGRGRRRRYFRIDRRTNARSTPIWHGLPSGPWERRPALQTGAGCSHFRCRRHLFYFTFENRKAFDTAVPLKKDKRSSDAKNLSMTSSVAPIVNHEPLERRGCVSATVRRRPVVREQ